MIVLRELQCKILKVSHDENTHRHLMSERHLLRCGMDA